MQSAKSPRGLLNLKSEAEILKFDHETTDFTDCTDFLDLAFLTNYSSTESQNDLSFNP